MNDTVFVFDMDGVIADTVSALHQCYLEFLDAFDIKGTRQEFFQLNGPSLEEIVAYLKDHYGLSESLENLHRRYLTLLDSIYETATPISGVQEVISLLSVKQIPLAIASSAPKSKVTQLINRFGIERNFTAIVSGDDVSHAKPSPDIYNAVKKLVPGNKYYVIEDSFHGMAAAHEAGMEVILFGDADDKYKNASLYQCRDMTEVLVAVTELLGTAKILARANSTKLERISFDPIPSLAHKKAIDSIWQDEQHRQANLFNGTVMSYMSHRHHNDQVIIQCYPTEYKNIFAQLRDASLGAPIATLGVSGLVVDQLHRTLIGRRSATTEYVGWYEFVPSGAIDDVSPDNLSPESQIQAEFMEETNMAADVIRNIRPFCLIHDQIHNVYDVGCVINITVRSNPADVSQTNEYSNLRWIKIGDIPGLIAQRTFVPTSIALFECYSKLSTATLSAATAKPPTNCQG